MALSDLLWACPACGEDRGLAGGRDACSACGTRFVRGDGATIRAVYPDGTATTGSAPYWLERLPDPTSLLRDDPSRPVRTARVAIRIATGTARVHGEAGYLNRVEVFDDPVPGTLTLHGDWLGVEREGEAPGTWPLESLTAVQASSGSLQLKRAGAPLVSFRFENDAIYLWEELLRSALRDFYGRTGRGVIQEFQPRIVARPPDRPSAVGPSAPEGAP